MTILTTQRQRNIFGDLSPKHVLFIAFVLTYI